MSNESMDSSSEISSKILRLHKDGETDKNIAKILNISIYEVKKARIVAKKQSYHFLKRGKYGGTRCSIEYTSSDVNVVKFHNNQETWKHYLIKCIIAKTLVDKGHAVVTEAVAPMGEIDVYDIDEKIAYEGETSLTPEKTRLKTLQFVSPGSVEDVIIFNLKDFPDDVPIEEWVKKIANKVR